MIKQLVGWQGKVSVNGVTYDSISAVPTTVLVSGTVIRLLPNEATQSKKQSVMPGDNVEHIITVKAYMTKRASPDFDFMEKWNNNVPMPMRTMVGTVEKETRGMVYMNLHGDLIADRMVTCMYCGRPLTNPVSQFFGCGPECGGHAYTHPFDTDEELRAAVDAYKKQLLEVKWSGWVIRSAIIEDIIKEEV